MTEAEKVQAARDIAREYGRKGGRPRTVQHKAVGYCRCAECRGRRTVTEDLVVTERQLVSFEELES